MHISRKLLQQIAHGSRWPIAVNFNYLTNFIILSVQFHVIMKRHIIAVLLLLGPALAGAQAIEVKAFGGLMMNSGTGPSIYNYGHSGLNALGGVGIGFRRESLEYGLAIGARGYSFRKTVRFADAFNPVTGISTPGSVEEIRLREPALAIGPVVNYHFGGAKLGWYAGLSPAYLMYDVLRKSGGKPPKSESIDGFSIEGQFGCTYNLLTDLRCFAEVSGGTAWLPYFMARSTRFWMGSVNVGAAFRIAGSIHGKTNAGY